MCINIFLHKRIVNVGGEATNSRPNTNHLFRKASANPSTRSTPFASKNKQCYTFGNKAFLNIC